MSEGTVTIHQLLAERSKAVDRAYSALARHKFWMFGYHASRAIFLGQLAVKAGCRGRLNSPFRELVDAARAITARRRRFEEDTRAWHGHSRARVV